MAVGPMKRSAAEALGASETLGADGDVGRAASIEALLAWLTRQGATGLDNVTVGPTALGVGVFAKRRILGGGSIATIPASVIMSVSSAAASAVGLACAECFADVATKPSREFVLWLDVAAGRHDAEHRCHPYLAALPSEASDATSWPEADLALLDGTNLGAAARAAAQRLRNDCDTFLPLLQKLDAHLFKHCDIDALKWARSMYFSRRFPEAVFSPAQGACAEEMAAFASSENESRDSATRGVLLPFFDLLDHNPETEISWARCQDGSASFAAGLRGVKAGGELFNCYGAKSNEELLMAHGFAYRGNAADCYGLELAFRKADGALEKRGPFYIHRADAARDQFPDGLWRALADAAGDEEEEDDGAVGIDADAAGLLLETLEARLSPFDATADADARDAADATRRALAAMYRDGQRKVLSDAVEALRAMLAGVDEGEDDDDVRGGDGEDDGA
ncbi:hypothetical protein M885DRAFT_619936 [Pelagophyceae sp. CCMP2097]|nr:hypothetical protein M885DRAFT_619936 [Pelagophyceae sp. CCMP2097]